MMILMKKSPASCLGTPFRKGDGRPRFLQWDGLARTLMQAQRAFPLEKGVSRPAKLSGRGISS